MALAPGQPALLAIVALLLGTLAMAPAVAHAACDADHTVQGCCAGAVLRSCSLDGTQNDIECNTKPPNPKYGAYYCGHDKSTASTMGCYTGDMIDYTPATGNVWCPGFCEYGCTGDSCKGNCSATQTCNNGTCKEKACGRPVYLRPNYESYLGQAQPSPTVGLVALCTAPVDGWGIGVRKNGTLVGWGDNGGVLGHANMTAITDAVQVACTQGGVTVMRKDGSLAGWGAGGPPGALSGATANVVQIAASDEATAALRKDGSIMIWGGDLAGKNGILNGKTGFKAVGGGEGGFVGVKLDGSLVVAARDGSQIDNTFFAPPAGLTGVVQVSLTDGAAIALKQDGTVVVWGSQGQGPPGDLKPCVAVGVGHYGNTVAYLALQVDGVARLWGKSLDSDSGKIVGAPPKALQTTIAGLKNVIAVDPHGGSVAYCLGSCGAVSPEGCCYNAKVYRCDGDGVLQSETCAGASCGWANSASEYQCSTDGAPAPGRPLQSCVCVPDCTGKQCGSDGCGGTCDKGSCEDGDGCTISDACKGENCVGGGPFDCDDGNPCTDDACSSNAGKASCAHTPNTASCDDGDACTVGDVCAASTCTAGKDALACDDGKVCTDDGCAAKTGCSHTGNSASCSDGDACTLQDACKDGKCAITASSCASANDGQTLTLSCAKGTIVDIGSAYYGKLGATCPTPTQGSCQKDARDYLLAQCKGKTSCQTTAWHTALGDPCPGVGKAIAAAFDCRDPAAAPQLACDDGNVCTNDSCDPSKGCQYAPNTASCDDNSNCTANDVCKDGKCSGQSNVNCDDNNPCTIDDCVNPTTCAAKTNAKDGSTCSDGSACHVAGACKSGLCAGITDVNCDDGNACTDDACDAKTGCSHSNNLAPCSDGDACTVADICATGACKPGTPLACGDGNPCTDDGCNKASGCKHSNNTASCDDGNVCTTADACAVGKCVGTSGKDCEDGKICTADSCNPLLGCQHADNTAPCDDGDSCTAGDACWKGSCVGGASSACNDGNPCTDDGCDAQKGCTHTPNTGPCNDGDPCTLGDSCAQGGCQKGGGKLACDDGNVCTNDACVAGKGCVAVGNNKPCDDGDLCTLADQCGDGTCKAGSVKSCDDGNPCTADACVFGKGCASTPTTGPCDDGNACTDDLCANSVCVGTPNKGLCDDGNVCTTADSCVAGLCVGGAEASCDDGNPCTGDHCAPTGAGPNGCWHSTYQNQWVGCDDGDACTFNDRCVAGACKAGTKVCVNGGCAVVDGAPTCVCAAPYKPAPYPDSKNLSFCCAPQCTGKSCGPDGCGGQCPSLCGPDEQCNADWGYKCAPKVACYGKAPIKVGCCDGNTLSTCFYPTTLNSWDCSKEGKTCGWNESSQTYQCMPYGLSDPTGKAPYLCPGVSCTPNCSGKVCGPDGCGGSCGSCTDGLSCDMDIGACVNPCDGVATVAGCVQGKLGDQDVLARCPKVQSKAADAIQSVCPADKPVGWYKATKRFICGGTDTPPEGVDKACKLPACFCGQGVLHHDCGGDGCGGSCGTCGGKDVCVDDNCCTPNCAGKQCGDDGCGGSCGTCGSGQECTTTGVCLVPACKGMVHPFGSCGFGSAKGGKNVLTYCGANDKITIDCADVGGLCVDAGTPVPTCAKVTYSFNGSNDYKGYDASRCSTRPAEKRCADVGTVCDCGPNCAKNGNCCDDYTEVCAAQHNAISCGDGTCNGGESCETCGADCGACKDATATAGPWLLPYTPLIEHAGRPGARARHAIRPVDDVRPQGPPLPLEGLLAWLPARGAGQAAPGTQIAELPWKSDGVVAAATDATFGGVTSLVDAAGKSRGAAIGFQPDAILPRTPSYYRHDDGGVTLAAWVRVPSNAGSRPNPIGAARAASDPDRYRCLWSRPQSAVALLDCGDSKIMAVRAYYGETAHSSFPAAPGPSSIELDSPICSLLDQFGPTYRCHDPKVQALAEEACLGRKSCWINPWQEANDPCLQPPYKPVKSMLLVQAICGPSQMDAALSMVVEGAQQGRRLRLSGPGLPTLRSQVEMPLDTWVHVAVTFEPHGLAKTGTVRLYVDGQPQATQQGYAFPRFFRWDWGVGSETGALPSWDGYVDPGVNPEAPNLAGRLLLDDAVLYDRALGPTELSTWIVRPPSGLARIWPAIDAVRAANRGGWAVGGKAETVPVQTAQVLDRGTGAPIASDFAAIAVPGGHLEMPADGADLDGLAEFSVAGWVRPGSLKADATLLQLEQGGSASLRIAVDAACGGKGMRVEQGSSTTVGSSDCTHVLRPNEWAFVAYVQKGGSGALYVDGAQLGSAAASAALFPSGSGNRTLRTGDDVALGWASLFTRGLSVDELQTWRSQGPAVWLDGALFVAPGKSSAQPRDFAGFVHAGSGDVVQVVDTAWQPLASAVTDQKVVAVVPENGRFRGGAAMSYTFAGTVPMPAQGGSVGLLRHAVKGLVQERLVLSCKPGTEPATLVCQLELAAEFSYSSVATHKTWMSNAFALAGSKNPIQVRVAMAWGGSKPIAAVSAVDGGGSTPIELRIGSEKQNGSLPRTLTFALLGGTVSEAKTAALALPDSRSALLLDGANGSGVPLFDTRLYPRKLGLAELGRVVTQDCAGQACASLRRSCAPPETPQVQATFSKAAGISACGACDANSYDDAGQCMPKASFREACSYHSGCANGPCVNGHCRAATADAACVAACRKLGRACVARPDGAYECGSSCLPDFSETSATMEVNSNYYTPTCAWKPRHGIGDICKGSEGCASAVCAPRLTTTYNVTNTNTKLTEPRYENPVNPPYKNVRTGPFESCSSASQCAQPAPASKTESVCAATTQQSCKAMGMASRLVHSDGWDGFSHDAYVCEGCLKDTYQGGPGDANNGKPLYVQGWSMLSPQACRTIYDNYFKLLSNGQIKVGDSTYNANRDGWEDNYARAAQMGDILAHPPEISRLRKLLLLDADPTSKPTPETLTKLELAGVGRAFLDPNYRMWAYGEYFWPKGGSSSRPEQLRLGACSMPTYDFTNYEGWQGGHTKSKFYDGTLNRPVCVENKFPNGTPCPPAGATKTYTRANAGLFCASGFCAADHKVCETGFQAYEEVNGKARNDGNDGGGGNDLGAVALVQDNGSAFRFDRVDEAKTKLLAGSTDRRHILLESHSKNSVNIFGWTAEILDMSVTLLESPGAADVAARAHVAKEFLVAGVQVPSLPQLPKASCGAAQFVDGEYKAPVCKVGKTSVGLSVGVESKSESGGKSSSSTESVQITDGDLIPTITYNIPIPLQECPDKLDGFKAVKGRVCFAKKTLVGPVPFKVEAQIAPVASVKFGVEVDSETFEPAAKITPAIGLALEVKGGVGGDIGPLELFAGLKGAVTIIEAALPVSFGLAFVQLSDGTNAITDLWSVQKVVQARFELNFLKLALSVFFEVGVGPIKVEFEYGFFQWDGISLSWKIGGTTAKAYKVDFQWDSYATSTASGHGGGQ